MRPSLHQADSVENFLLPASESPPGRARVLLWLLTATATGAVIMGLELAAFRLYAPFFGYSIYVWGSLIAVVMLALSAGYAVGGWLADRSRTDTPLYLVILASAFYQLVIVFTFRGLLRALWQWGEFSGTVTATLIIFAPPMAALAVTSPYVVRLLARAGQVGTTAGRVYAVSTLGSIAGIFATSFYVVPRFGTHRTLQLLCLASAFAGIAGLVGRRRGAVAAVAPLGALAFVPASPLPEGVVWRSESAYNFVWVVKRDNLTWLVLNDARFFQTIRREDAPWTGYYHDEFVLGPLLAPARRLLVLGMGAGGSIAATRGVAPEIEVDAVEIDPEVVEVGRRFFNLRPGEDDLRIHVADARPWLAREHSQFDIVHVDLYHGGPYVPFYLATQEFYQLVRDRMHRDAVLMMNIYDVSPHRELLHATGATLRRVFDSVFVLSREDGNHITLAFPRAISIASIRSQLAAAMGPEQIRGLARRAAEHLAELNPPAGTLVFTDDRAPVEEMTRQMLLWKKR